MKLYRNLCQAVAGGLDQIFIEGGHASQVIEALLLSNKKWGARDRHFIAHYLYDTIRYYRLYCYAASLDHIASGHDSWQVLGANLIKDSYELPQWPEWESMNPGSVKLKLEEGSKERKIRESIPDWLDLKGEEELGAIWETELSALNKTAPVCIRVNTLKATKESVLDFLRNEEIEYQLHTDAVDGITILSRKNLRNTYPYKSGWFEIQDISSQKVATMLDPKPGMVVVDACAGAGGKTLHIAALMKGKGEIIAMDIYPEKIRELENRARRNGATNINAIPYTKGMVTAYQSEADRLLLDVPCSGTGVMRRNPDAKWKLTNAELDNLLILQQEILTRYSPMVKPGGIMVYATCSILPSENETQIEKFLKANPDFEKTTEMKILPSVSGNDGFYICRLSQKS